MSISSRFRPGRCQKVPIIWQIKDLGGGIFDRIVKSIYYIEPSVEGNQLIGCIQIKVKFCPL